MLKVNLVYGNRDSASKLVEITNLTTKCDNYQEALKVYADEDNWVRMDSKRIQKTWARYNDIGYETAQKVLTPKEGKTTKDQPHK